MSDEKRPDDLQGDSVRKEKVKDAELYDAPHMKWAVEHAEDSGPSDDEKEAAPVSSEAEPPTQTPSFMEEPEPIFEPISHMEPEPEHERESALEPEIKPEPKPEPAVTEQEIPEKKTISDQPYYDQGPSQEEWDDLEGIDDEKSETGSGMFIFLAILAISAVTALRLWLAASIGLGDAEAYYASWAKNLDLSYYDHPPGVAWLIALAANWLGETTLAVRLPSIVFSAMTALGIFIIATALFSSRKVGFIASLLFLVTPAFFVGGCAAAPDVGFGFFWILSAGLLLLAVRKDMPKLLLAVGFATGLGLLFKYFMFLFWPAALLYLLFGRGRKFIFTIWFPLAILISLACFSPVLIWNAQHDWVSFTYHLVERHVSAGLSLDLFWTFLAGQVLYLSPIIAFALLIAVLRSFSNVVEFKYRDAGLAFWMSVPVLVFFYLAGAWTGESEPHWPLVGYMLLFPVLVQWVSAANNEVPGSVERFVLLGPLAFWLKPRRRSLLWLWLFCPAILIDLLVVAHLTNDGIVSMIPDNYYNARYDLANELTGWDEAATAVRRHAQEAQPNALAASYHYTMCGQLSTALGSDVDTVCLSQRTDAFDFLPSQADPKGRDLVFVTDNRYDANPGLLLNCGVGPERLQDVPISRGGREVRRFSLWRCKSFAGLRAPGQASKGLAPKPEESSGEEKPQPIESEKAASEKTPKKDMKKSLPEPAPQPVEKAPETEKQPEVKPEKQSPPSVPATPQVMEL